MKKEMSEEGKLARKTIIKKLEEVKTDEELQSFLNRQTIIGIKAWLMAEGFIPPQDDVALRLLKKALEKEKEMRDGNLE